MREQNVHGSTAGVIVNVSGSVPVSARTPISQSFTVTTSGWSIVQAKETR